MTLYPRAPRLADGSIDWARIEGRAGGAHVYRRPPDLRLSDGSPDRGEIERWWRTEWKRMAKGKCLPREATFDVRLAALAKRLDIATTRLGPLSQAGEFENWDDFEVLTDVWNQIGERLMFLQPEFWTLVDTGGRGRPRGASNKLLATNVSKEALRKRRQREKTRQSKIRRRDTSNRPRRDKY
jgi:hypothetical protein